MFWANVKQKWVSFFSSLRSIFSLSAEGSSRKKYLLSILAVVLIFVLLIGMYWSREPAEFSVAQNANEKLALSGNDYVVGAASTAAMIRVAETLLHKPGGYLSNDVMPPGLYLDNIPNWEFGALVQVRDLSGAFRESFSRSQSQSVEDPDLIVSEPNFHFDTNSWLFPPSESEYTEAIERLYSYLGRIADPQNVDAQFYARAIERVDGVSLLDFGTPEAMWHLQVHDFPAIVTMDAHGASLHREVEKDSGERLATM